MKNYFVVESHQERLSTVHSWSCNLILSRMCGGKTWDNFMNATSRGTSKRSPDPKLLKQVKLLRALPSQVLKGPFQVLFCKAALQAVCLCVNGIIPPSVSSQSYVRFLSAHFSSLSRPLWTAALLSSVLTTFSQVSVAHLLFASICNVSFSS